MRSCQLFLGALFIFACHSVFAGRVVCNGYSTLLYSSDKLALTICHGLYTKINLKLLNQWQGCDDGEIQIHNKMNGNIVQYADCLSEAGKQFRVSGSNFILKHFQTKYPGFESEPLLVETLNLETGDKSYQFKKKFPVCTKRDVRSAIEQIDSTIAKPFDGRTYFGFIYGGFYKLRDCAQSEPALVLSILRKYKENGHFDGEVAETLSSVISEVELIDAAAKH